MKTDYIIDSSVSWPGTINYRGSKSRTGYATFEEAADRLRQVERAYNARYGTGTNLRVVKRTR